MGWSEAPPKWPNAGLPTPGGLEELLRHDVLMTFDHNWHKHQTNANLQGLAQLNNGRP